VWVGAESGSQKVLDAMEKGTTVDQVREAATRLKAAGIKVAFFLQFGYPGETWEDIEATLQLVRDCYPDDIGISVSYPLPGTPFYERVETQITGARNWVTSDDMAMLYDGPYPTSFYRLLHARVHAEFRLQKARRGRGLLATGAGLLARRNLRLLGSLIREAVALPFLNTRLARRRSKTRHNDLELPVALTREQASSTEQPDEAAPVGSR
jgi:anaerobic magnesium-protoporphyrin IX monomethyl ester cyclase